MDFEMSALQCQRYIFFLLLVNFVWEGPRFDSASGVRLYVLSEHHAGFLQALLFPPKTCKVGQVKHSNLLLGVIVCPDGLVICPQVFLTFIQRYQHHP